MESQEHSNDTFIRAAVSNAQCLIGAEKYPVVGFNCDFLNHRYIQAHGDVLSRLRHLTKDNIPHPYITHEYFRKENNRNQMGYKLCF